MSNSAYAQPGDTIEYKDTKARRKGHMLVIKKPVSMSFSNADNEPGCAWFMSGSNAFFLRPKHYNIVKRAGEVHRKVDEVVEVNGVRVEVDVDASLKRQRDDIFREMFGS